MELIGVVVVWWGVLTDGVDVVWRVFRSVMEGGLGLESSADENVRCLIKK